MFTGLIEATGRVSALEGGAAGARLRVASDMGAALRDGDSIAVNGVCLTVAARDDREFLADLSRETLSVTSLGGLTPGRLVNLERPLRADARLGGHFVLGHVDAVGRILAFTPDGDSRWLEVELPAALDPYVISRGSIAVDGISLTVASVAPARIGLQIIPFTLAHTTLAEARVGEPVNLEVDVLGKYVVRLIELRETGRAHDTQAAAALVHP